MSDRGLIEENPYEEFSTALEQLKRKLGLPIGGSDLRIGSQWQPVRGGEQVRLRMPSRKRIQEFMKARVEPALREQIAAGLAFLHIHVLDEEFDVRITIDPSNSPYNTGGYSAYDTPAAPDKNPLYRALKAKAHQLKGSEGLTASSLETQAHARLLIPSSLDPP